MKIAGRHPSVWKECEPHLNSTNHITIFKVHTHAENFKRYKIWATLKSPNEWVPLMLDTINETPIIWEIKPTMQNISIRSHERERKWKKDTHGQNTAELGTKLQPDRTTDELHQCKVNSLCKHFLHKWTVVSLELLLTFCGDESMWAGKCSVPNKQALHIHETYSYPNILIEQSHGLCILKPNTLGT